MYSKQPLNNMKYCPITMVAISNDSSGQDPINYFNGGLIFPQKFAIFVANLPGTYVPRH